MMPISMDILREAIQPGVLKCRLNIHYMEANTIN